MAFCLSVFCFFFQVDTCLRFYHYYAPCLKSQPKLQQQLIGFTTVFPHTPVPPLQWVSPLTSVKLLWHLDSNMIRLHIASTPVFMIWLRSPPVWLGGWIFQKMFLYPGDKLILPIVTGCRSILLACRITGTFAGRQTSFLHSANLDTHWVASCFSYICLFHKCCFPAPAALSAPHGSFYLHTRFALSIEQDATQVSQGYQFHLVMCITILTLFLLLTLLFIYLCMQLLFQENWSYSRGMPPSLPLCLGIFQLTI